jgi:hypothetical protein
LPSGPSRSTSRGRSAIGWAVAPQRWLWPSRGQLSLWDYEIATYNLAIRDYIELRWHCAPEIPTLEYQGDPPMWLNDGFEDIDEDDTQEDDLGF